MAVLGSTLLVRLGYYTLGQESNASAIPNPPIGSRFPAPLRRPIALLYASRVALLRCPHCAQSYRPSRSNPQFDPLIVFRYGAPFAGFPGRSRRYQAQHATRTYPCVA
jgi:hypothetical protein